MHRQIGCTFTFRAVILALDRGSENTVDETGDPAGPSNGEDLGRIDPPEKVNGAYWPNHGRGYRYEHSPDERGDCSRDRDPTAGSGRDPLHGRNQPGLLT